MEHGEGGNPGGGKPGSGGGKGAGTGSNSPKEGGGAGRLGGGDKTIGGAGGKGRAGAVEGKSQAGDKLGKPGGSKPGEVKPPSPARRIASPRREFACGTNTRRLNSGDVAQKRPGSKVEGVEPKRGIKVEAAKGKAEGKAARRTKAENDALPDVSGEYEHSTHTEKGKTYKVSSGFLHKPGTVKVHKHLETSLNPGEYKITGLARGHQLGARFGATDRAENHDPQNARINNGTFKQVENRQASLLRQGFKVHGKVVSISRRGEAVPHARGIETRIYSPDGKTLLRTERLSFINRAKPPESDGKGVKGKLCNGDRHFNRHQGNVIRVGRFQGGKGEAAPEPRLVRRDFGKENVVRGDFRDKAEKPDARLDRAARPRSGSRRPEPRSERPIEKAAGESRRDTPETKGATRFRRAERVAREHQAMEKARAEAEEQAKQAKEKADKAKAKPNDRSKK